MRKMLLSSCALFLLSLLALPSEAQMKGAKAIFYSGEGPTTMAGQTSSTKVGSEQHSTGVVEEYQDLPDDLQAGKTEGQKEDNSQGGYLPLPEESGDQPSSHKPTYAEKEKASTIAPAIKTEKYMGIEYWISLVDNSGRLKRVTPSQTFRSGERIKLNIKANRNGYLYVMNVGSTGNSHVLFPNPGVGSNFIKAWTPYEIPYNTYMRFDQNPGEELLLVMLSPKPMGELPDVPVDLDLPPATQLAQAKGTKDLVLETCSRSSKGVASFSAGGAKDIILETEPAGANPAGYCVTPISTLEESTITLRIKLVHN